jgi:alkylation response protein AidB-like acyl-CoA dehydrogenase
MVDMNLDFEFSKKTNELRERVLDWSVSQARPLARDADRRHAAPEGAEAVLAACPVDLAHLSDSGKPGARWADAFAEDGAYVVAALVQEAVAYGDSWPFWARAGSIGQNVVKTMGTPAQKERWLGAMDRGEMSCAAFALTESHFGSDVAQVATTAVREGDRWIINGTKMYCSMGASADYVVVFATIDKAAGRHGIRAFVVERGTPGFKVAKRNEEKLGIRCAETSELLFERCAVPLDHCLGWSGEPRTAGDGGDRKQSGFLGAVTTLGATRPLLAGISLAIARAARDVAAEWARERRSEFTRERFARLQDDFARMDDALTHARRLVLRAAWMRDRGIVGTRESAAAKAYGPPVAERVIRRSLQIMGPDGTSEKYLVEKWHRDVKIYDIFEGSGQVMRITISRDLMGAGAARG